MTRRSRMLTTVVMAFAIYTTATVQAGAADRVYWSNAGGDRVSYANLDGSGGGGNLNTTGAINGPGNLYFGLAIDLADGKVYWANYNIAHPDENVISYANLDGSGGGTLNTTGATVKVPIGVAIDPATNRIYWANSFGPTGISWANLDGSGGGDLNTTGATVNEPVGVAIDPTANRIYWANASANEFSWASLDGSGGGNLEITGPPTPTIDKPEGVAIDPVSQRIYWANREAGLISWAALDGSEGEDIDTSGATVSEPIGVAVDPTAGRIYWGNFSGEALHKKISFASLDGSGGADLNIAGAIETGAFSFPALLKTPSGTEAPTVTGGSTSGSTLSCSQGSWATDVGSEFLFQTPQSYAYAWQRDGADIPEADGATLTATQPGLYSCRVTATNQAGSSAQSSGQLQVNSPPAGPPPVKPGPAATIPTLTGLSETNRAFVPSGRSTPLSARATKRRAKRGTTFSFRLDQAATVTAAIQPVRPGRRVHGACVPNRKGLRHKPKCVLHRTVATLTRGGLPGANRLPFSGRIRGKALKPGRYRALFSAADAAGASPVQAIGFRVLAP